MYRQKSWPVLCFALLLLIIGTPDFAASSDITVEEVLKVIADTKPDFNCYVCNTLTGDCSSSKDKAVDDSHIRSCRDQYVQEVWGEYETNWTHPSLNNTMRNRPYSLSEMVAGGNKDPQKAGWVTNNFPNVYTAPSTSKEENRFSGLSNWHLEDPKMFEGGFKSCRVLKIVVPSQINNGKRGEIVKENPRVIRTCSFVDVEVVKHKDTGGFDDKGCRIFNFKMSTLEVCYCAGTGEKPCNGTTFLRVSHWIIGASLLVFLVKYLNKN